jgi:serine/threonine protein phosphatase 1
MSEKIFAIGDIHGCRAHLERLLEVMPINSEDRLIFIGDYIDRGPDSEGVVTVVESVRRKYPQTVCLMGNHEQMLLDFLSGQDPSLFLYNGGKTTLNSYGCDDLEDAKAHIPKNHLIFYQNLLLFYETEDYIFVHAGLRPNIPLNQQNPTDLLWIRDEFYVSRFKFQKKVIFGHTPFSEPLVRRDKIGIDTGVVYGNKLTCLELPDMRFYQV